MSGEVEIIVRGVCVLDDKLLLCHSKGASNTYLPGGHVDFGEDAAGALVREIDEELGLAATVTRFLGACDHAFLQKGEKHCEVNLVFEMQIDGLLADTSPESQEDYIEFRWMDLATLSESNLEPSCLRASLPEWMAANDDVSRWASGIAAESH